MAASAAFPGLFFCFLATVLLVIVSVSSPTWESISFLNVGSGSSVTHFGVFGYTGSKVAIGYDFAPKGLGFDNSRLNTALIHNLTKVLVLHPVAAAFAGLAVLFGLCGLSAHRSGTVFMSFLSTLAAILTFVIFIIDMVLFGIARHRFRDQGIPAQYGNAIWMVLGALLALLVGACASICGVFGRYRKTKY